MRHRQLVNHTDDTYFMLILNNLISNTVTLTTKLIYFPNKHLD